MKINNDIFIYGIIILISNDDTKLTESHIVYYSGDPKVEETLCGFGCYGYSINDTSYSSYVYQGELFDVLERINCEKCKEKFISILEDDWTVVTLDGSLSAQFEQTLLVTNNGFESLTPYDL